MVDTYLSAIYIEQKNPACQTSLVFFHRHQKKSGGIIIDALLVLTLVFLLYLLRLHHLLLHFKNKRMINFYTAAKTICLSLLCLPVIFLLQMPPLRAQPVISFNSVINNTSPTGGAVTNPIDIVNAGDGTNRLFIVQQGGIIKVYNQSPVSFIGDFLTVTGITSGGERGLLSMAFHPDYKNNGYLFVYYTNASGDIELARYHTPAATPNAADPNSKQVLLTIPHPGQSNHNGGKLNFGADGYLYFATGDGGGGGDVPNNAQTGSVLLGKMLRINVGITEPAAYTIPSDNPFLAPGDGIRDEIWAFGLRNPFRWSFDRLTHDMWIADVGQDAWEEVNFRTNGNTSGLNYGWHCKEGTHDYNGGCALSAGVGVYAPPLLDYPHDNATGGFAVIGGYVYRGTLSPAIYGYYIFADEVSSNVWLLPPNGAAVDTIEFRNALAQISSFGEGENGELYVASLGGQIYNVVATGNSALPVKLIDFSGLAKTGFNELDWHTSNEIQLQQYQIEYSPDGIHFEQAGVVAASGSSNYHFTHTITAAGKIYYRLKMADTDGSIEYSKVIIVSPINTANKNFVAPSVVNNGMISVNLYDAWTGLQIINMDGQLVYKASIINRTGKINIQVPSLHTGHYLVRLVANDKQATQRILVQ